MRCTFCWYCQGLWNKLQVDLNGLHQRADTQVWSSWGDSLPHSEHTEGPSLCIAFAFRLDSILQHANIILSLIQWQDVYQASFWPYHPCMDGCLTNTGVICINTVANHRWPVRRLALALGWTGNSWTMRVWLFVRTYFSHCCITIYRNFLYFSHNKCIPRLIFTERFHAIFGWFNKEWKFVHSCYVN